MNTKQSTSSVAYWMVRLAIVMYVAACALPALEPSVPGLILLALGWLDVIDLQFAWYANLFLWAAWLLILVQLRTAQTTNNKRQTTRRWSLIMLAGIAAFIVGLDTLTVRMLPIYEFGYHITGLGIGGYLWFGSMVVTVIGASIALVGQRLDRTLPM